MKKILLVVILMGVAIFAYATPASLPPGINYVTGATSGSTPVTIALAPLTGYFQDFDVKIINPNAAGVTGAVIITSGGVTVDNASPAPGSGGWITNGYWFTHPVANNQIVLTDVSGIGVQYSFKIWVGNSHMTKP